MSIERIVSLFQNCLLDLKLMRFPKNRGAILMNEGTQDIIEKLADTVVRMKE